MSQSSPYEGRRQVASLGQRDGLVTLIEGQTFCISGRTGDMFAEFPQGLFVLDTRVVSSWELRVNGHRLEPLTVDVTEPFAAGFVGRGYPAAGRADAEIVVFRQRDIGSGMRERISVVNYGLEPADVAIELVCGVDFAGQLTEPGV